MKPYVSDRAPAYTLGHAPEEMDRLLLQARLYGPVTAQALRQAGLGPGMRVLDAGCGAGDVTFIAAEAVGPGGSVTGVDAGPEALDLARARLRDRTRGSGPGGAVGVGGGGGEAGAVDFLRATLPDVVLDGPVDALIGRLVLGHQDDPVAFLRRLTGLVRPGGLIAFQEFDNHALRAVPETPLAGAVLRGITGALRAGGKDRGAGARLYSLFRQAGLVPAGITATTPMGGVEDPLVLPLAVHTYRTLCPRVSATGLGPDADREAIGDPATVGDRMRAELDAAGAALIMPTAVTVWATTPTPT
ncbi:MULTISPECIES: class I SAM-dependent methyltransferase [Streptomyces]|uniref:class I SAM-dependent methyltransferase n=1 Tax=Streptomyces TaxID=1883 RepID=UPI001038A7BE|nr:MULTISPECIES: class I SAM-dependent methyltransferase [Streptomyces]MBT3077418.1 class I SAM-dependent methyltransferase [Streptomyces sp. COG21]MBT3082740.1 class I SAM-dependent methyltransferase [Streptomyces sp. COG20]MBT3097407.1 class I SAM-dependent methyltransferase [Streptomyces sp. CBG30]MBT3104714.1 class I SAM-dependent methyltransferase [Streptomyces sp. COG19]MDI7785763.1 class I SAM-dependent methyltransferase [Streptomyces cavourensis]